MSSLIEIVEEAFQETEQENPPPISPSKKAEHSWPTEARRLDTAPAWPPFSGHRVPLGGGS